MFQLKEKLELTRVLDRRKHLVAGCSCKDEAELKRSLEMLVDMLLGES